MKTHSFSKMSVSSLALSALIFSLTLLPVLVSAVGSSGSCDFPVLFNFGDSNSDTGGLSAVFGLAPSPNGETYFKAPAGRYSDGRLLIDFIAKELGLPYLSAYLNPVRTNFTHGINFATAGSTILPPNSTLQQSGFSPIFLGVQYIEFSDIKKITDGLLGFPKQEDYSRALYTFDIGQNDLTIGYFSNKTVDEVIAYIPQVLDQFQAIIKNIHWLGGRSFWIHNTGPVGCLPYVMDRMPITLGQVDEVGCAAPFNDVAKIFNQKLNETVVQLRKDLPDAAITLVDIYSLKYALFSEPKKYGFEHPFRACCGHGGKFNYDRNIGCGGMAMVDGKEVLLGKSCKDPKAAVVWDGVHFTDAANHWIFNQFVDGGFTDPPTPLRMACHRH